MLKDFFQNESFKSFEVHSDFLLVLIMGCIENGQINLLLATVLLYKDMPLVGIKHHPLPIETWYWTVLVLRHRWEGSDTWCVCFLRECVDLFSVRLNTEWRRYVHSAGKTLLTCQWSKNKLGNILHTHTGLLKCGQIKIPIVIKQFLHPKNRKKKKKKWPLGIDF